MEEDRTLLIGIDLCNDYSQISCINRQTNSPDSIAYGQDKSKLRIPTALVSRRNTGEWLIGDEAVSFAEDNKGDRDICLIENLFDYANSGKLVEAFDTSYSVASLFEKFFKRLLTSVKMKFSGQGIKGITVTSPDLSEPVAAAVKKAFAALGIGEDRLKIISHLESFMYYTISQSSDIWVNDVGLFDYDRDGLMFYRLSFGRKAVPMVITATKEDLSENLAYKDLSGLTDEQLSYSFGAISGQLLHKQIISALFVTGAGFEGDWTTEPLKALCTGRRVFRGQNLYTKGACYYSKLFFEGGAESYICISDEMLLNDISIRAFHDGSFEEVFLAHAGDSYRNVSEELYVIMDGTDEIDLIVRNVLKKDPICAIISLGALGDISGKDRRMRLNLSFLDRDTAVITIRDDGFGDLRPSSMRIWEQILKLR